jgi:hypothetical protein
MNVIPMALAALLIFQTAAAQKPTAPKPAAPKTAAAAPKATDVAVAVTYKGKGAVDATHRIIVFMFADANITSASRPVGPAQFATKNGETVTFPNVTGPVYVFAVYDEKGTYDGVSGPPPAGIPTGLYAKTPKGTPTAVAPGSPVVKLTFDDTQRWNK